MQFEYIINDVNNNFLYKLALRVPQRPRYFTNYYWILVTGTVIHIDYEHCLEIVGFGSWFLAVFACFLAHSDL